MKYESPSLSTMGQMEELTGSMGTPATVGDAWCRCANLTWEYDWENKTLIPVCYDD